MAWWIFQNLVTTAALAAVVAIVCRFGRFGPVARHALWVLVLVKFVTPPLVVWPWAAPDPLGLAKVDARGADRSVTVIRADTSAGVPDVDDSLAQSVNDGSNPGPAAGRTDEPGREGTAVWALLLALWGFGSVCLLAIEIARLVTLARRVRHATPADSTIERRVIELATALGVRPMPVVTLTGSTSPVVWCLGRPRLLWPAALADSSSCTIDGLIVHELAHVERRDHVVGWIELVAGLAWWWNPLFWSVRRALREQAELACDAWVISAIPNGRRAYAESLLTLSSLGAAPSQSIAAVVGVRASSRRVLERRLVMIMKGRAPLRLPSVGVFTLAVLAMVALPGWATRAAEETPQQPQAAQSTARAPETTTSAKPTPVPARAQTVRPTKEHTVSIAVPQAELARPQTFTVAPLAHDQKLTRFVTALLDQQTESPKVILGPQLRKQARWVEITAMTDEAQNLVKGFDADRDAIQKEANAKVQARRDAAIKDLEALQDQYAKAGKLDEAVAIRNFLKAGGPSQHYSFVVKRKP